MTPPPRSLVVASVNLYATEMNDVLRILDGDNVLEAVD